MAAIKRDRLGVGVVGLGRLWEARHKPALTRLEDRFRVVALYDHVARRSALEARQLRCHACEGLTELIERPDVDVVYILTAQWFGLHALELASAAGKPIYCALPVASDPHGLNALAPTLRARGTPFVPELARRFYPATLRLRELLATSLGSPRLVLGHSRLFGFDRYGHPGPTTQLAPSPLPVDPGANLIDWCRFVFQAEPESVLGFGASVLPQHTGEEHPGESPGEDFEGFVLKFPGGESAQITYGRYHRTAWGEANRFLPAPGFQVYAERGAAWLEMPDHIQWSDARATHEERLPLEPSVGETINDNFYRLMRGQQSLCPTLDDALAIARLVDVVKRSRRESRTIQPDVEPTP